MKNGTKIFLILFLAVAAVIITLKLQESSTSENAAKPTVFNIILTETPTAGISDTETPKNTYTNTPAPTVTPAPPMLPEGFVYVSDVIPTVTLDIRYYGTDNFVGDRIDGYLAPTAILTVEAAEALKQAADYIYEMGYKFVIYDAYRPVKAVNHFVRWAEDPDDTKMKERYYPTFHKSYLIDNYISSRSTHSRGSTIDLSLLDMDGNVIDMGGYFDYFDVSSRYEYDKLTEEQRENRRILRDAMVKSGFTPSNGEWWHFRLTNEPYPETYFDFDVK